jgi:hypothetical protein
LSQITEHLSEDEYRCRCKCGRLPPDYDQLDMPPAYDYLFDCFENVREKWGKPLNVTSGYRCAAHNKAVGGGDLSAHLFGLALDILCEDKDEVKKLRDVVREACPDLRIGWKSYGENLLHFDCAFYVSPRPTVNFVEGCEW